MSAREIVQETLLNVLPPGVPPSFVSITSARFDGRNRIDARLIMVDGLPAAVNLTRWALGWSHRFTEMPGGALSFENGEWVRVADEPAGSGRTLADATKKETP